jgi:hypothetical protein
LPIIIGEDKMGKLRTAIELLIHSPLKIVPAFGKNEMLNFIPDKVYLKWIYYIETGQKLNLVNPTTFNEKLQWLKLYDHNPLYTILADKYAVREYISQIIGETHLIPLLGVYNDVDEIPWNDLPEQFVLKCNHGSGMNIICKNKNDLDIPKACAQLSKWMTKNAYWGAREWSYKNIVPKVICEKYMVDESGYELKDYKFFSFNGEVELIQVDIDRFSNHRRNLYNLNWEFIDATIRYPNDNSILIKKPICINEMIECAKRLSLGIPHVRVDFYSIFNNFYFGELTFYHGGGFERFSPNTLNKVMGDKIELKHHFSK